MKLEPDPSHRGLNSARNATCGYSEALRLGELVEAAGDLPQREQRMLVALALDEPNERVGAQSPRDLQWHSLVADHVSRCDIAFEPHECMSATLRIVVSGSDAALLNWLQSMYPTPSTVVGSLALVAWMLHAEAMNATTQVALIFILLPPGGPV